MRIATWDSADGEELFQIIAAIEDAGVEEESGLDRLAGGLSRAAR